MSLTNWLNRGKHQPYCTCVECKDGRSDRKQTRLKHELEQPAPVERTPRVRGQALAKELKNRDKSLGPKITTMEKIKRLFSG